MLVTKPMPAVVPSSTTPAPAPAPALGAGAGAAPIPAGPVPGTTPKLDDAPAAPAGQAADGATQQAPAPNGGAAPADAAAAAKQAIIEKLEQTTASDAMAQVDEHLGKLAALSVGGGTPEGAQSAKVASALLTDSSMLLQHAHVKAMETIRNMATELHMRLMSSVSGLAYMGGQVAVAGQSETPVKIAEIAAGPIAETKATMTDVIDAITPKDVSPTDAKVPVPNAPNGNTGVAGGVAPDGPEHVTPGPGVGADPNPA